LLDTSTPRTLRVLMMSQTFLGWLQTFILIIAAAMVWRTRRALIDGWNHRRTALRTT
jgi:hypothetical protein